MPDAAILHAVQGAGRGRPPSARAGNSAAAFTPNGPMALAEAGTPSPGRPYTRRALAEKLAGAGTGELHAMVQVTEMHAHRAVACCATLQKLCKPHEHALA